MLLLHISDIHFQAPQCHTDEDPELHFRQELVAHATDQVSSLGDVDALLVSGDVAFRGIKEEYDAAEIWLEELATVVGCKKNRIYVIPGNHDVDWKVFDRVGNARNAATAISNAGDNTRREGELKTQLKLKDSAENLFASIGAYNIFAAKYDCQSYPGRLRWKQELRMDSRTVLMLHGLNTTLISGIGENDRAPGRLFMGSQQLNFARAKGTVNLVMAHHPPEWMSDAEDINTRLLGSPNIVMFGHKHIQKATPIVNGPIVFSAGSVNPERHVKGWQPAYNFVELSCGSGEDERDVNIGVHQFKWQSNPNGFVPRIDTVIPTAIDSNLLIGIVREQRTGACAPRHVADMLPAWAGLSGAKNSREENAKSSESKTTAFGITGENIFKHVIKIRGENQNADDNLEEVIVDRGNSMPDDKEQQEDSAVLAAPNIRDLIYRFWELTSTDRGAVLNVILIVKLVITLSQGRRDLEIVFPTLGCGQQCLIPIRHKPWANYL